MRGLILAGGEGSRLRTDGIEVPKPMVEVAGRPQIARLSDLFRRLGCETVTCLVRDNMPEVEDVLRHMTREAPPDLVWCHTPSSLHTLVEGLRAIGPGPVFCTMTDTVMRGNDWRLTYRETERHLDAGVALVLVVTPFIDDENPLYVERDASGYVTGVGGPGGLDPRVTGGVYGLSHAMRGEAERCLNAGLHRMRAFLRQVVERGAPVATVEIPRIIDLDRRRDLEVAEALIAMDSDERL